MARLRVQLLRLQQCMQRQSRQVSGCCLQKLQQQQRLRMLPLVSELLNLTASELQSVRGWLIMQRLVQQLLRCLQHICQQEAL
jgi:hypothetical protein